MMDEENKIETIEDIQQVNEEVKQKYITYTEQMDLVEERVNRASLNEFDFNAEEIEDE